MTEEMDMDPVALGADELIRILPLRPRPVMEPEPEPRHGGRLPDPGLGAVCARCDEPREAHGGPSYLGACPDQSGLCARRFQIRAEDREDGSR